MYPTGLELKRENANTNYASFLDLDINVIDNKLENKLYYKINAFKFGRGWVRVP